MTINVNILPWYSAVKYQHHRQFWAYDRQATVCTLINQIPPFQLVRDRTNNQITEFKIINFLTGTETDVLTAINTAGLTVLQPTGKSYDLIKYPAYVPIVTASPFAKGTYYCRMKDAVNTWYSELFTMVSSVDDLVKIEYCHNGDFDYPNGHIDYSSNYVNYVYFPGHIAKPKYEYEEEVDDRNGRTFPIQQTSWKLHVLDTMLLPEYLLDAMRLIRQHDSKSISYNGITHTVDEFIFDPGEWISTGDLCETNIEFKTDLVVVNTVGRGVLSTGCAPSGLCMGVTYVILAEIEVNSPEYNGGYYVNQYGQQTSFVLNDLVLVENTNGQLLLKSYNSPGSYSDYSTILGELGYIADTDIYYYRGINQIWVKSALGYEISGANWLITFTSIPTSIAEFYYVGPEGETFITVKTVDTFNDAFTVPIVDGVTAIRMKIYNATCGHYQTAEIGVVAEEPAATVIGTTSGTVIGTIGGTTLGIFNTPNPPTGPVDQGGNE